MTPFSEMPVLLGGEGEEPGCWPRLWARCLDPHPILPALRALAPPSTHSGRVLLIANPSLWFCLFHFPFPWQGQHLSHKSFARRTSGFPYAGAQGCASKGVWPREAGSVLPTTHCGLKGLPLLRGGEEVRSKPETHPDSSGSGSHPSPNPCSA